MYAQDRQHERGAREARGDEHVVAADTVREEIRDEAPEEAPRIDERDLEPI